MNKKCRMLCILFYEYLGTSEGFSGEEGSQRYRNGAARTKEINRNMTKKVLAAEEHTGRLVR